MLDLQRLCRDMDNRKSPLRRQGDGLAREIYAFLRAPSPRAAEAARLWREDFRAVYGEVSLSAHRRLKPETLLADYGITPEGDGEAQLQQLLFAVQTYYSLLVKTAMAAILGEAGTDWRGLLSGSFAAARGVANYCEPDWYCWPIAELENGFDRIMEAVAGQIHGYESSESGVVRAGRDDWKRLYEALIPRQLRHALGEYYTPDWLASYTLDRALAYHGGDIRTLRTADPACGSGTFLTQAIARKRQAGAALEEILDTVWGFDINPLAVLTAKSGYLLSVLDLLGDGPLEIPVRRGDALTLGPEAKKADLAVGNPPWVNWEYLPASCREGREDLWLRYGLLEGRGVSRSFLKTDISDLITYLSADYLLAADGALGFLVRQGVFKSAQNGAAFRRFRLPDGTGLGALGADDFSQLKIFGGAAGPAAALFLRKGAETAYPIPYRLWTKAPDGKRGPIDPYLPPEKAMEILRFQEQRAIPASPDAGAPWLTAPAGELEELRKMLGNNPYRARTGVFTGGANGVYWLTVRSAGDGLARVSNLPDRAKRKTRAVETEIEDTYIYPMLKGGGVHRWRTSYDAYLLCPHTAETRQRPVPWDRLREEAPKTAAYLASFREALDQRRGFASWERFIQAKDFHAVLRVGRYTFAPWKVVWRYIASSFICAVIGEAEDPFLGRKLLIPNEKVMYAATECEEEAYYLCGVLSSAPAAGCVKGFMNPTSISAHVLERLRIPQYDPALPVHRAIAEACREGHTREDGGELSARIDALDREL